MKRQWKNRPLFRAVTLTASIITAAASLCILSGCSANAVVYPNADRYTAGDAEIAGQVEKIEIGWTCGEVYLKTADNGSVTVAEENGSSLSDDRKMHWWLDGTTLHIRPCASGLRLYLREPQRKLTVTLPASSALSAITVETGSANVRTDALKADSILLSTASGTIDAACEAENVRLNSTSGDIDVRQSGTCGCITLHSTSGTIRADLEECREADFDSTSGTITVCGTVAERLSAASTSGSVRFEPDHVPDQCRIDTTSGNVTLLLPEGSGFTAKVTTTSGDFTSDLALRKDGDTYSCGDGHSAISVSTTSGDVVVGKK